jgi:hypothetical protein
MIVATSCRANERKTNRRTARCVDAHQGPNAYSRTILALERELLSVDRSRPGQWHGLADIEIDPVIVLRPHNGAKSRCSVIRVPAMH